MMMLVMMPFVLTMMLVMLMIMLLMLFMVLVEMLLVMILLSCDDALYDPDDGNTSDDAVDGGEADACHDHVGVRDGGGDR